MSSHGSKKVKIESNLTYPFFEKKPFLVRKFLLSKAGGNDITTFMYC